MSLVLEIIFFKSTERLLVVFCGFGIYSHRRPACVRTMPTNSNNNIKYYRLSHDVLEEMQYAVETSRSTSQVTAS